MGFRVTWGCTRFVILVGPIAIKVARVRPYRALRRLIEHRINGEVESKLLSFADNPVMGGIRYILAGFIANQNESYLWQATRLEYLVPTKHSLLLGLINIQERGVVIHPEDVWTHPFRSSLRNVDQKLLEDLTKRENFCWHEGKPRLLDYGNPDALIFLAPVELTLRRARA